MSYAVKEMFYSLQGEGAQSGRAAVFCRFAGCNLWSGREDDRASATCSFCDTDFIGVDGGVGGRFRAADKLARSAFALWPKTTTGRPMVVCTGGEPFLQLDKKLIAAFHDAGFEVAAETNGALPAPDGLDWVCVSPKAGSNLVLTAGDELKLVYPQPDADPRWYENLDFRHFFLQPMDGAELAKNTESAMRFCLERPKWRLSLQIQKQLGIR